MTSSKQITQPALETRFCEIEMNKKEGVCVKYYPEDSPDSQ